MNARKKNYTFLGLVVYIFWPTLISDSSSTRATEIGGRKMKRREMEMHPDYHALLLNNEQRHGASGSTPTLIHRIQWLDYPSTITAFFLLQKIAIANK